MIKYKAKMFEPRLVMLFVLFLILSGCQQLIESPNDTIPTATKSASEPIRGFDPTDPELVFGDDVLETSPIFQSVRPETLVSVGTVAELPDNIATGQSAPDFEARLIGNKTFSLGAARGKPVLIIPTALGCAECITNLRNLADVYPSYRSRDLTVLVLDIILGDEPEIWQRFADYLNEPKILWGVVTSTQFTNDYDVLSLGSILLVDPEGHLIYRNDYPLSADGFHQLLDLASQPVSVSASPRVPTPLPQATLILSTPTAKPTILPTASLVPPTVTKELNGFSSIPGNTATGRPALDFSIKTVRKDIISLADWRDQYVLLLPTAPGCGDCMRHINMLEQVYPDFRGQGIQVVLVDLENDNPGFWEFLAGNIHEPEFVWGAIESAGFVLDYEISALGTILLIDPSGTIVYRSDMTQPMDVYRQLFEVATTS